MKEMNESQNKGNKWKERCKDRYVYIKEERERERGYYVYSDLEKCHRELCRTSVTRLPHSTLTLGEQDRPRGWGLI